mgnify:CR=1 FL=1
MASRAPAKGNADWRTMMKRSVMRAGQMIDVLRTDANEQACAAKVTRLDDVLSHLRDRLRQGLRLTGEELEVTV